jgi:hypothetical protein
MKVNYKKKSLKLSDIFLKKWYFKKNNFKKKNDIFFF